MKMIMALIVFSALSTGAFAKSHGPAGCGLGSILFEGKTGLVWNVLGATFNGSSGNQTFGMTTGTSNCDVDDRTKVASVNFIEANKVSLANDVARGNGETLAGLGRIYGCSNVTTMGSALQTNYGKVFVEGASATEINANITNVIASEKACI